MTKNYDPSVNPANEGSLQGTLSHVLNKFLQNVDDMIPAKVISFDRDTNRATVQPLIMIVKTDGTTMGRSTVSDVPVFQYSGGGFVINFPLKPNDIGWLKATDRDMGLFKQNYGQTGPNTFRKHSFEDAVFFPDVMRGWNVTEEGVVMQTLSGNQCIAVNEDHIKIISDTEVIIDSPLTTITGELRTGTDSGGQATFGGNVIAIGEITTQLNSGINLSSHLHTGVDSGPNNTGGPI